MIDFFKKLFEVDFMPHGHCWFWKPEVFWTHAISDSIIAMAYFTIPLSLVYIIRVRKDVTYKWMVVLFAVFILGCGATHVMGVVTIWNPVYRLDGLIKAITALASIGTAIMLVKIMPALILMPSAEKWRKMNEELQDQIRQLKEKDQTIADIRQFQFLAESIPQLVWTANPQGKIDFCNERFYEYTGVARNSVEESNWISLMHPQDQDAVAQAWGTSVKEEKVYEIEMRLRSKNNSYRWFLARAVPMRDKDGKVVKWFGTGTDIHDGKSFREELRQANKELVRTNTDLDNFIYTASHELKAPILNMEGLIEVFQKDATQRLTARDKNIVQHFGQSIEKLRKIIDELTTIASVQRDNKEDAELVSFAEIMEEVEGDLSIKIAEAGAVIQTKFEADRVSLLRQYLRTILYNLISNALKFREPSRPLYIQVLTRTENNYTVLEVTDNGLGIDASQKEKIFSMFRRMHSHVEGSGIGLYIVRRIVENRGGKIQADSSLGRGTTIRIYLKNNVAVEAV
jgi:PAS domain S-box-containing protein